MFRLIQAQFSSHLSLQNLNLPQNNTQTNQQQSDYDSIHQTPHFNQLNLSEMDGKNQYRQCGQQGHSDHIEECCEFHRKQTFYGHPLFDHQAENLCLDKISEVQEQGNENPQISKKQKNIIQNLDQNLTTNSMVNQERSTDRKQVMNLIQNSQTAIIKEGENEKQKLTQSQQLIDLFDQEEELESLTKQSLDLYQSIRQKKIQIKQENQKEYQQKIDDLITQKQHKSVLREIQSKIKKQKQAFTSAKTTKFSLKQFNQKKKQQFVPSSYSIDTSQIARTILQKIKLKKDQQLQTQQKLTQKLVQMLALSIFPQIQKLGNEYKQNLNKMNLKIEALSNDNGRNMKEFDILKFSNGNRSPLSNQSVIRINLNEDFDNQVSYQDELKQSRKLAEISQDNNQEFEKPQNQQNGPTIKRTDSEDNLYVTFRSDISDCDILSSVKSRRTNRKL